MSRPSLHGLMLVALATLPACGMSMPDNRVGAVIFSETPAVAPLSGTSVCAYRVVVRERGPKPGVGAIVHALTGHADVQVYYANGATLEIEGERYRIVGRDGSPYPVQGGVSKPADDPAVPRGLVPEGMAANGSTQVHEQTIPCGAPIAIRGERRGSEFVLYDAQEERERSEAQRTQAVWKVGLFFVGPPLGWVFFMFVVVRHYAKKRRQRIEGTG